MFVRTCNMSILSVSILAFVLFSAVQSDLMINRLQKDGVPIECHFVTTEDGYILRLYHLSRNASNTNTKSILLMHGLVTTSECFVTYTNISMGYYFYNHGFDVWIGNERGNTLSRNHTTLDPDEGQFWQFSWHEMGMFDLPAIIDFILDYTKQEQIIYSGHSQGGTIVTILLSERPEYNDKIASVHLIAGAVIVVKNAAPKMSGPLLKNMREFMKLAQKVELFEWFSHQDSLKIARIIAGLCSSSSITELCNYGVNLVMGTAASNSYYDGIFSDITNLLTNGASYMQFIHFGQLYLAGRFQKFDHGPSKNMELYGSTRPPEYNMSNIRTKIHIIYGTNDNFVQPENIPILLEKFKDNVIAVDKINSFNHIDFLIGRLAHLTPKAILKVLNSI